jgi:predicted ATP-grasp superfamily ATP-dependent carboligase
MKNILVLPCATQIGVEQFLSLRFNKDFKLIGAAHNDADELFDNYIKLKHPIDEIEFIDEIKQIVKDFNIHLILPSHDEVLYILKNVIDLEPLIPGNSKDVVNTCRFKSKTYEKLKNHPELCKRVPNFKIIDPGFLKPDKGQGSRGSMRVETEYVWCEYLPGKEYTVDCFTDHHGELLHCNPRLRTKIVNGISETTTITPLPIFKEIATKVNEVLGFRGSWFFQVKIAKDNILKFLEVAPRIGGGSNINRLNGVNLTLSDLYQHIGYDIELLHQDLVTEVHRKSPKYNLEFNTMFIDYDDTYPFVKDVLPVLGKEIVIITRSTTKVDTPHKTFYIGDEVKKSTIINKLNKHHSIFIDDSFRERKDVLLNCHIPCIMPEEINYLL